MERPNASPPIVAGVILGFLLLIAAVWASDTSVAASLALTGGIVLAAVGTVAAITPGRFLRSRVDDQRDRMKQTTP